MKPKRHVITLNRNTPPVVELDSAAMAAYIRFSRRKVSRTEVLDSRKSTVTVDYDSAGDLIGIELIGVKEFTLDRLLEASGIVLEHRSLEAVQPARYIRAGTPLKV